MQTVFENNHTTGAMARTATEVMAKASPKTLVLFHGTGGDEHDLLPLGRQVAPGYNLLGLRGAINEGGLNRFFIRTAVGVFDQQSIRREAAAIQRFLTDWVAEHKVQFTDLVFLGFSNGANMILALAFLYPDLINQAVVLHPMLPFMPRGEGKDQAKASAILTGKSFLVSYGLDDPLVSLEQSQEVAEVLRKLGGQVEEAALPGGHQLSLAEVERIQAFLQR